MQLQWRPHAARVGTPDWIAQHALDWLPAEEKQFFIDNLAISFTALNCLIIAMRLMVSATRTQHHVYFGADGVVKDDSSSAVRAPRV